mgnify:CR=1 FL=1
MDLTMLNKIIASTLIFLLAFPAYVLADESEEGPKVYSIKKNEKARVNSIFFIEILIKMCRIGLKIV